MPGVAIVNAEHGTLSSGKRAVQVYSYTRR